MNSTSYERMGDFLGAFAGVAAIAMLAAMVIVHVLLATSVMNDIGELAKLKRGPRFMFAPGWGFVVLITGPIGFALYWVVHHSSLRDPQSDVRL